MVIDLHANNIKRDGGKEIPEAWLPLTKKHSSRISVRQQTSEATVIQNSPISAVMNRPIRTELGVM